MRNVPSSPAAAPDRAPSAPTSKTVAPGSGWPSSASRTVPVTSVAVWAEARGASAADEADAERQAEERRHGSGDRKEGSAPETGADEGAEG